MIVRVFNSGRSNGESPVNYLMSDNDHTGKPRAVKPEVLEGHPATTISVINSIERKHKYVSGVIAFRPEEKPSRDQLKEVIKSFKSAVLPGLGADQFNSLFVLHRDKTNVEVHFIVPSVAFISSARSPRLNIHPPGPRNMALYNCYVKVTNHRLGYNQVVENPVRAALASADRKNPHAIDKRRNTRALTAEIALGLEEGKFRNRHELCAWLHDSLDVEVTRQGDDYISVRLPGASKATRLKGPLFKRDADYRSLQAKSGDPAPVKLTGAEFAKAKSTLATLVQERATFNVKAYLSPRTLPTSSTKQLTSALPDSTRTTTKEKSMPVNQMRKIIQEALTTATQVSADRAAEFKTKPKAESISGMLAIRSKAITPGGFSNVSGLDAIHEVQNAIGVLQLAIDAAVADVSGAKTPREKRQAETRLASLLMQLSRLNQQLEAAKVRQINQPSGLRLKL